MNDLGEYQRWRGEFFKALDARLWPITYFDELVRAGRARFIATDRAALICGLRRYPSGALVGEAIIGAGDLPELAALSDEAEAWGKEQGAIIARVESRSGWIRELKQKGYRIAQTALEKDL